MPKRFEVGDILDNGLTVLSSAWEINNGDDQPYHQVYHPDYGVMWAWIETREVVGTARVVNGSVATGEVKIQVVSASGWKEYVSDEPTSERYANYEKRIKELEAKLKELTNQPAPEIGMIVAVMIEDGHKVTEINKDGTVTLEDWEGNSWINIPWNDCRVSIG